MLASGNLAPKTVTVTGCTPFGNTPGNPTSESKLAENLKTYDVAKDSMCNAAKEIAENFNKNEYGVSVEGTWQRRGHTSLNGCINGKYRLGSYAFIVPHLQNMLL
ncbi:hypothetical protein CEXT_809491 [Caerostris extrusa]|uniref:Uncharacterized protein n=1 Tax=Caerostris extrusa TaxID=172846 RepID=A0AAV4R3Q1_CAEEX|nr:hypothetical protein CEXT_809491 [Caerostris extrusa]